VEDRSRNVRGVADPLDEEERLANLISDRISPRLLPEIEILAWRQTQVLALPQACMCGWDPPIAAPMPS
jgi:ATP-dependent DNA helicase RecG